MPVSPSRRVQLESRLASRNSQLLALETTYSSLLTQEIEQYNFNSGEGSQSTRRRRLDEIEKLISKIEADIDYITRTLNGTGVVNMRVRRYP